MMKKTINLMVMLALTLTTWAQDTAKDGMSVASPDGKLTVSMEMTPNGEPTYSVAYDGKTVIEASKLGFDSNLGEFSHGLTVKTTKHQSDLSSQYTMNRSKQSIVVAKYNEMVVELLQPQTKLSYSIRFRVKNNDVAFRYEVPNQPSKQNGKAYSIRITDEKTSFCLPHRTSVFLSPQSDAMIGWKGTKPSYEEEYVIDAAMDAPSQYGKGWTFPCLFREVHLTQQPASHGGQMRRAPKQEERWVLISETGVDSRYCASRLGEWNEANGYKLEFPMAEENGGNGTREPAFALPGNTPWRTITVGSTLQPIVETTIPWDFVSERFQATTDYRFGRGTWSWIVWQDNSICWNDQVQYIQLARQMGYEYVLIDNWWDNNIGRERMAELIRYAQSQGVDVFLWYSSSGYWNDIEQGPINIMTGSIERKREMAWMKSLGVKGIKVDFFGGDKQETMRLYEEILSDANDNQLMVIFHGCTLPRGWERMYPNYVGSEAVLASENIYFQQHFCDVEAQNTALHPFIRNTVGCMEFGGCFMNRHINRGNKGGNTRRTTDCHELATCILFQNPIQNFALTPENLVGGGKTLPTDGSMVEQPEQHDAKAEGAAAPKVSMDFLRQVPTTWDETRFISGYPGRYAVLARRHGNQWYVAGNNATGSELSITITPEQFNHLLEQSTATEKVSHLTGHVAETPVLPKGTAMTLLTDNLTTLEPQSQQFAYNGKALTITMPSQGGFVLCW